MLDSEGEICAYEMCLYSNISVGFGRPYVCIWKSNRTMEKIHFLPQKSKLTYFKARFAFLPSFFKQSVKSGIQSIPCVTGGKVDDSKNEKMKGINFCWQD